MTPLVAGIALTGKAPVYENVYMSGLKQKAAGEAAAAKERNKQLEDIRAAIKLPEGGVHNSLVGEVKDVAAETLFNVTKVIEADPVRGINKAWDMVLDFKSKMNVYSNTSKQLAKIETPEYNKNYFSSPQFIQGIGTKNLKDVESDPAIVENAKKAGVNIQRVNGLPVVSTIDYPRFDPAKPFVDWQKATVAQYEAEVGDPTKLGKSLRQEILKRVNEQEAMAYLEGSAADDNEVAAWQNKHNINITTPEGRKAAAQRFLYTQEKTQSYTRGTGRGSGTAKEELQVLTKEAVDPIKVRFGGNRSITGNKAVVLPKNTVQINLNGAYNIGEDINATELGEQDLKAFSGFEVQSIRNLPTWKGKTIKIPKGTYGDVTFDSEVTLQSGTPLPNDVKDGLFKFFEEKPPATLQAIFGSSDKNALKKMIVEKDWILGAGVDEDGNLKKETTVIPVTSERLSTIEKSYKGNAFTKVKQHLLKSAQDIKKLYDLQIISAATKGAETQPQSGFSLLQFDTFA